MGFFSRNSPETLDEIEEQTTLAESKLQLLRTQREEEEEKTAIALLKARGEQWKDYSIDGTRGGFSLDRAKEHLKSVGAWLDKH